jgi:ketosteroid isomerase-like protein
MYILPANAHAVVLACVVLVLGASSSSGQATQEVGFMAVERAQEHATRTTIENFNQAFNRHDADSLAALMTEDTVFEDTSPAPDGRRIQGKSAVVDFWRGWFARNPDAHFEAEDIIVSGNRAVVLWTYRKMRNGQPWHIRGVDIFTVRDGKVAAKLAYVKG